MIKPGVTDFAPDDRVGFSFGYCGACEACRTGRHYGCRENRRLNFGGVSFDNTRRLRYRDAPVSSFFGQGAFAGYAVVHRNNLIPVDEDMPPELAAPMGCGIQTGAGAIFNYIRPESAKRRDPPRLGQTQKNTCTCRESPKGRQDHGGMV